MMDKGFAKGNWLMNAYHVLFQRYESVIDHSDTHTHKRDTKARATRGDQDCGWNCFCCVTEMTFKRLRDDGCCYGWLYD